LEQHHEDESSAASFSAWRIAPCSPPPRATITYGNTQLSACTRLSPNPAVAHYASSGQNPGGSTKDRNRAADVEAPNEDGTLHPGTDPRAVSGRTGIGPLLSSPV